MKASKPRKHSEPPVSANHLTEKQLTEKTAQEQAKLDRVDAESAELDFERNFELIDLDDFTTASDELVELDSTMGRELDHERTALLIELTRDSLQLAVEKQPDVLAIPPTDPTTNKGNADLLRGDWVSFHTARIYLGGRARRPLEIAAKKGTLTAKGSGLNRRISRESLVKYLPPTREKRPFERNV